MRPQNVKRPRTWPGFTLIELLIVMVIIGIIITFILQASFESLRRAQERQTQALISKIETALAERFDAVYATRATANDAHRYLGAIWSSSKLAYGLQSNQRAQVIARLEYLKSELPDVFILQADTNYPLNFAAQPFPSSAGSATSFVSAPYAYYLLPFGVGVLNDITGISGTKSYGANPANGFSVTPSNPAIPPESTGIFGASYEARGAIMKGLIDAAVASGAAPPSPLNAGYDGVDNDNPPNGMIDDLGENGTAVANAIAGLNGLLSNHTHKTARAEVLYALLVEGQGPFGSLFDRGDFTDSEVKDTDGDGMLEFVDAWGQPLQFYRWPIGYVSEIADLVSAAQGASPPFIGQQRGLLKYTNSFDTRDQNPLDPGQTLLDPAWWAGVAITPGAVANDVSPFSSNLGQLSGSASWFQSSFYALTDPNAPIFAGASPPPGSPWDRGANTSSYYARRAYYSKFLVISGGPDMVPGVPVLDLDTLRALTDFQSFNPSSLRLIGKGGSGTTATVGDLLIECQAAPATPLRSGPYLEFGMPSIKAIFPPVIDPVTAALIEASKDDISSHNMMGPGGATQ